MDSLVYRQIKCSYGPLSLELPLAATHIWWMQHAEAGHSLAGQSLGQVTRWAAGAQARVDRAQQAACYAAA